MAAAGQELDIRRIARAATPRSVTRYLELADYLLVAEEALGVPAELIADRLECYALGAARERSG